MTERKDLDRIIQSLRKNEKISQYQIKKVCDLAKDILKQQKNVVKVRAPITICGDIHGQFDDLLELMKIGGYPPYTNYIFLGDYVDRGKDSVQTFLLLLTLKVRYKNQVTLMRGNHQCRLITQVYGFYDEVIRKYGNLNIWKLFTDIFDYLPLSAVVEDSIYCVHGGLSPNIKEVNEIQQIDRFKQIPQQGSMCDLLWSDPDQVQGWVLSQRGAGYAFGKEPVEKFCQNNKFSLVVRAHQLVIQGYKYMFDQKLVTVWSAPNYYSRCGNVASILELDEKLFKFYKIFEAAPYESESSHGHVVPQYFL